MNPTTIILAIISFFAAVIIAAYFWGKKIDQDKKDHEDMLESIRRKQATAIILKINAATTWDEFQRATLDLEDYERRYAANPEAFKEVSEMREYMEDEESKFLIRQVLPSAGDRGYSTTR